MNAALWIIAGAAAIIAAPFLFSFLRQEIRGGNLLPWIGGALWFGVIIGAAYYYS